MVEKFGESGFDPTTDIAGIVLNRWGHAYTTPEPGFMFGRGGPSTPPDVGRRAVETLLDRFF